MVRRRKPANPVAERRRLLLAQAVGLALLVVITLFLVYKAMTAV